MGLRLGLPNDSVKNFYSLPRILSSRNFLIFILVLDIISLRIMMKKKLVHSSVPLLILTMIVMVAGG